MMRPERRTGGLFNKVGHDLTGGVSAGRREGRHFELRTADLFAYVNSFKIPMVLVWIEFDATRWASSCKI